MNGEKVNNRFVRFYSSRPGLAAGAVVLLLVLAIYARSLWFGYVNYDDGLILSKRWIEYRQLSWEGLVNMFSFMGMTSYQPLRHLALAVVYRLWGLNPFGYHLFNLLFYLLNVWVVFLLLRKLLVICGGFEGRRLLFWSWAGTAWFAVHPVHVESVAWMLSNKELLAGLFYFLALLSYLKSWERGFSTGQYLASWVFLALGMLSKPNVAALPLVIIAFEVLFRRRDFDWKLFALRVVPFLALVGAGAVYYIFYTSAFTGILHGSLRIHSLSFASVLAKYVKLLLLPVNLCNSYPPPYFTGEYNYRLAIYLLVDLGIFTALAYALLKGRKAVAFAILFFLLNLLPVSGIFPISILMAERYLYLSSLGIILAGVVLLSGFWDSLRAGARARRWLALGGVSAVIALTVLAAVRCRDWKDGVSLWGSAARTYPNFQFNHYALGVCLHRAGRLEEALVSFQKTNMFHEHLLATYHIAHIMDEMGDSAAAEDYYSRVARLYTKDVGEERMLATVYERLGKPELAARVWLESGKKYLYLPDEVKNSVRQLMRGGHLQQALELAAEAVPESPPSAGMRTLLAELQVEAGEYEQAGQTIRQALAAGEDSLALLAAAGDLHFASGDPARAFELYSRIPPVRLRPVQLERLAAGYYNTGRLDQSLRTFRLLRDSAGRQEAIACNNVGVVLEAMDSLEAAEAEYRKALELKPDYADAWFNLGNVAVKLKKLQQALEYYTRALELEGVNAEVESARGAVLLELGRYDQALGAFRGALALDSTRTEALLGAADALWQMDRTGEAAGYYRRLLNLAGQGLELPDRVRLRASSTGKP